mmetsp:Transcript_39555/g.126818  ORF Transcript_39555/g.126818 Transcript_39555/m.126818 type:complete len:102 (+) Transcript_39555:95-400(+)
MAKVRSILRANLETLEARDLQGFTAVLHAAWHGQAEVVRVLLETRGDASAVNLKGKDAVSLALSWIRMPRITSARLRGQQRQRTPCRGRPGSASPWGLGSR